MTAKRLPPASLEFERIFLGNVIKRPDVLFELEIEVFPEIFYNQAHQEIYRAITQLSASGKPIDIRTISDRLKSNDKLEFSGGQEYLIALTNEFISAGKARNAVFKVYEQYIKREAIRIAERTIERAYSDTTDAFDVASEAGMESLGLIEGIVSTSSIQMNGDGEIMKTMNRIEERIAIRNTGKLVGVSLGFADLDKLTGGGKKGELILIAGRPGMGKTALGLCILANSSAKTGEKLGFISIEMAREAIQDRQISISSEVSNSDIAAGSVNQYDWDKINQSINLLKKQNIILNDSPEIKLSGIRSLARRWVKKEGVKMIMVDYLQIITSSTDDERKSREVQVAKFARGLKSLSKELKIPIIALAQVNRDADKKGGAKPPSLSDLRESGALEQEADIVIFIHRPEYYGERTFADGSTTEGVAQIIIAKQRNGPVGEVVLKYIHQLTKFTEPQISLPEFHIPH